MPKEGKNQKVKKKTTTPTRKGGKNTNNSRKRIQTRSNQNVKLVAMDLPTPKRFKSANPVMNSDIQSKQKSSVNLLNRTRNNDTDQILNKSVDSNKTNDSIRQVLEIDNPDKVKVSVNSDEELDFVDDINDLDDNESIVHDNVGVQNLTEKDLMGNPHIEKILNKMMDERFDREFARRMGETSKSTTLTRPPDSDNNPRGKVNISGKESVNNSKNSQIEKDKCSKIKSPSDTTIYVLALKRNLNPRVNLEEAFLRQMTMNNVQEKERECNEHELISQNVSDFVDSMRKRHEESTSQDVANQEEAEEQATQQMQNSRRSEINIPGFEEAQSRAERTILQAEKFKASIEKPPGNFEFLNRILSENELPNAQNANEQTE